METTCVAENGLKPFVSLNPTKKLNLLNMLYANGQQNHTLILCLDMVELSI